MKRIQKLSTNRALQVLNISRRTFKLLGLKPVATLTNEYKKKIYLYSKEEVDQLIGSEKLENAIRYRKRKPYPANQITLF